MQSLQLLSASALWQVRCLIAITLICVSLAHWHLHAASTPIPGDYPTFSIIGQLQLGVGLRTYLHKLCCTQRSRIRSCSSCNIKYFWASIHYIIRVDRILLYNDEFYQVLSDFYIPAWGIA